MTQYFLYLTEAGICLALFYLVYWLLIRNDTFHKLKRFYLLASLLLSLVIPLLPSNTITRVIEKNILPAETENNLFSVSGNAFEKLVLPGINTHNTLDHRGKRSVTLFSILCLLYFAGSALLLYRLTASFLELFHLVIKNESECFGKFRLIRMPEDSPTFSFFRFIFFNDSTLNENEKNDVLMHEKAHADQLHSLDIIFVEIIKMIFWFIPVIWLYKSALSKVHECLADEHLTENKSGNLDDYHTLLLKQYLSDYRIELAQPFNYSLIKFRISMMTRMKSKWQAKLKFLFAIPVIVLSLAAFTNNNKGVSVSEPANQKQLNQLELFKKFSGTWIYQVTKDTSFTLVCKTIEHGIDLDLKGEANGALVIEQKGRMEYDSKSDRLIQRDPQASERTLPIAMWFTSENLCEAGEIKDISNPAMAPTERKWEFKTDDLLVLSVLVNGKFLEALVLKRKII